MSIFPKVYEKCPYCGCHDTLFQVAVNEAKQAKLIPDNVNIDQMDKKEITALKPKANVIGLMIIPVLIEHYGTCVNCGRERLTKAEIGNITVNSMPNVRTQ